MSKNVDSLVGVKLLNTNDIILHFLSIFHIAYSPVICKHEEVWVKVWIVRPLAHIAPGTASPRRVVIHLIFVIVPATRQHLKEAVVKIETNHTSYDIRCNNVWIRIIRRVETQRIVVRKNRRP